MARYRRATSAALKWIFLLLLTVSVPALRGDPAIQNQQKAKEALDAMVAALGGQKWLSLSNSMLQGRTSGFFQGKPTGAIADFTEILQFPDQARIEMGKKRDVVELFDATQGWEITYRGKRELPKDDVQNYIRRRNHTIRIVVTEWMKDPNTILIYGGQNLVERHLADQITIINARNDSITIQTDATTHLPLRRSWQWRDPLYKDRNTDAEEYDDYHLIDGIPTPYTTTRYHNGDMTTQRFLYRGAYNVQLPAGTFDVGQTVAKIKK